MQLAEFVKKSVERICKKLYSMLEIFGQTKILDPGFLGVLVSLW